jgi:hypothetical protein
LPIRGDITIWIDFLPFRTAKLPFGDLLGRSTTAVTVPRE